MNQNEREIADLARANGHKDQSAQKRIRPYGTDPPRQAFYLPIGLKAFFRVSSIDLLPLHKRIEHYRRQAAEALRQAGTSAEPHTREGFLKVAAAWHGLSVELERLVSAAIPGAPEGSGAEN